MYKKRSEQEKIDYHINRLTGLGMGAMEAFFKGGLNIQNSPMTYDEKFAERKLAFTCAVLTGCGFCQSKGWSCDRCKLTAAHANAIAEIKAGIRKKPEPVEDILTKGTEFVVSVKVDKRTGRITQTLYPVMDKRRRPDPKPIRQYEPDTEE